MHRSDSRRVSRLNSRGRGFTVLEVIVALAISGLVLLGGRLLLENLATAERSVQQATRENDREANADRLLRSLAGRLEVGTDFSHRFGGDDQSVHFTTWCDTPQGWLERCDAVIRFEPIARQPALIAQLIPIEPRGEVGPRTIVLTRGFRYGVLRYLNDARSGGQWFVRWGEAISAPLAIGIVIDSDTSIVRIGGRE